MEQGDLIIPRRWEASTFFNLVHQVRGNNTLGSQGIDKKKFMYSTTMVVNGEFVQGHEVPQVSFFESHISLTLEQLVLKNNHPSLPKLRLKNKF
jgi:hypothetical protein